ncbi:hypothetical protein NQ314_014725 [Rhamnusium bicolor]|uniref:Uncharacterized protein n=1 Tax=Rhamnusium bicolor TaxID=1586634 RepID=A0AAV8X0W8_9CUCU|nr:hypothetical protein NQ314_014725 [Rhamnusium bicolor]
MWSSIRLIMAASSNLFFDLLVEEYKNRTQNMDLDVDVVGTKRKNFETMLNMAHNDLRKQNFADAKQKYYDVLDYLENEPYHDELNLLSEEEFCIKCCFSYSSLMDSACFQEKNSYKYLNRTISESVARRI